MDNNTSNKPKAVKPMTTEERRKRRLAWMCGVLGVLNLIALALLILLPYNCTGTYDRDGNDTTVVKDTTIIERVITHEDPSEEASDEIDEAVEEEGGDTDAFMRFTIMWNENGRDIVDLDAHAEEPSGAHIYFQKYRAPRRTRCGGQLDVDMQSPRDRGVENIVWPNASQLDDGDYEFGIHNYNNGRFGNCTAKLKVGNKSFIYKVGYFKSSHSTRNNIDPRDLKPIAVVTIKNHQVKDIKHIQQPVERD